MPLRLADRLCESNGTERMLAEARATGVAERLDGAALVFAGMAMLIASTATPADDAACADADARLAATRDKAG